MDSQEKRERERGKERDRQTERQRCGRGREYSIQGEMLTSEFLTQSIGELIALFNLYCILISFPNKNGGGGGTLKQNI